MDLCHTWEVSPGRREQREESAEEEPPSFLPPVRMGCGPSDSAVHEYDLYYKILEAKSKRHKVYGKDIKQQEIVRDRELGLLRSIVRG